MQPRQVEEVTILPGILQTTDSVVAETNPEDTTATTNDTTQPQAPDTPSEPTSTVASVTKRMKETIFFQRQQQSANQSDSMDT